METVMEQYGSGLLQLLGGVIMLALIGTFLRSTDSIVSWIMQYLYSIAG